MRGEQQYRDWLQARGLRPATIDTRARVVRRVEATVGPLELVDEATMRGWFRSLAGYAPSTRASTLTHVRDRIRFLILEGARADDPTVRLPRPRVPRLLPHPIAETDLAVALAAAPRRVRPWLMLAAYAGLRCGEIARLRGEHVRDDTGQPVIVVADGKGGHQRIVPARPDVLAALPPARRGPLFRREDGQPGPVPAHRVSQLGNRYLHSLGVDATMHSLRHRFGTQVYAESLDLRVTQELLGHVSPVTTAGYAAWSPARGADAVLALPSRT